MNLNKLLLTAILLFSLLVLVLEDNKFNNQQIVMFVIGISALYVLFMVTDLSNEGFTDYKGSYAGYKYNTSCNDGGWRKEPCNTPLNETMGFVPQGTTVPPNQTDGPLSNDHKFYPSVDGVGNKNSMFMFAYNQASPDCCPSTFSTSTGCICTTEDQRNYVNNRGGNNSTSF